MRKNASVETLIFSEDFPPDAGGVARWAYHVAKELQNSGRSPVVMTSYRTHYAKMKLPEENFPVHYLKGRRWKQLRSCYYAQFLLQYIRRLGRPMQLIATTWNIARIIVWLARMYKIPVTIVGHGTDVTRKVDPAKKIWRRLTLLAGTSIIAVSRFTKARMVQELGIPPEKISVFPNGVDTKQFHPIRGTAWLRREFGIAEQRKVILTHGRIIRRKGHDQVLCAFAMVREEFPQALYIISGPWHKEFYLELRELINRFGLSGAVRFWGYVPEEQLNLLYNLSNVYVMPSRELYTRGDVEGFGITYLEANACEKPVIGGLSGGVPEAVVHGETGFLVDPLDSREIAGRIRQLLSDSSLAARLGRQGRRRVLAQFGWDRIVRNMISAKILI